MENTRIMDQITITITTDAQTALQISQALRDRANLCERLAQQQPFRPETPGWAESFHTEADALRSTADAIIRQWNQAIEQRYTSNAA
jgi:hypothetical protein